MKTQSWHLHRSPVGSKTGIICMFYWHNNFAHRLKTSAKLILKAMELALNLLLRFIH